MNTATEILCNGWPRTVAASEDGVLKQTYVHGESEFDLFFNSNRPDKNLYFNIARMRQDMRPVTGLVPFDFDSPLKNSLFEEGTSDAEKISKMREDEEIASEILGEVWSDVQSLVGECWERGIPVISVFSGLGVHSYLLFQEETEPTEKKASTSMHYVEECDLSTWDRQIVTDTKRILRIPNSQRVDENGPAGAWCIPMTEPEVLNNNVHDLLSRCSQPKDISFHSRYEEANRPTLQVYDDVDLDDGNTGTVEIKGDVEVPENVKYIINSCIPLPCVRERFLSSNPHHMIRFTGTVLLYQVGFKPKEVQEIISQIGWIDYDRKVTKKMTENIWKSKYSELSCSRLQSLGLCVYNSNFEQYSNEKEDCETHRYKSGKALYPYQ